MLKKINRCDLYLLLWVIYQLQDLLGIHGFVSQSVQVIMIIWAFIEALFVVILDIYKPKLLKLTTWLISIFTIYGIFLLFFNVDSIESPHTYLQSALNSLLPIILFYRFSNKGLLNGFRISRYSYIILIVTVVSFYLQQSRMLSLSVLEGVTMDEFTNNVGYEFVALIPLIFFVRSTLLQYLYLFVTMSYVFMSMKRGAILIGIFCAIYFLWVSLNSQRKSIRKSYIIVLIVVTMIAMVRFVQDYSSESDYFYQRLEQTKEGNVSQRDILFSKIWEEVIEEDNIVHIIVGRGAKSTIKVAGDGAHNDWLEVVCNNGLLGLIVLFLFYKNFYSSIKIAKFNKGEILYKSFVLVFVIAIFRTMVSQSIQAMSLSLTILIGYFLSSRSDNSLKY